MWCMMGGIGSVLGPLFFLLYVNGMARATGELGFVLFTERQDPAGLFERVNGGLAGGSGVIGLL
jgi:hypothetical protein